MGKVQQAWVWVTAPIRYLVFLLIVAAYSAYIIGNELTTPVRKWWRRNYRR